VTRRLLATLGPLSVGFLLALTPSSVAASTALVTRPVSIGSYTLRILADTSNKYDGVDVVLFRRVGNSTQQHEWPVIRTLHGNFLRLTASHSLRRGSLSASGGRVRIKMIFRARGLASSGRVPWCRKRGLRIAGTLSGRFELRTRRGRFGTVVRRHLHGWLLRGTKYGSDCGVPKLAPDPIVNEQLPAVAGQPVFWAGPLFRFSGRINVWNPAVGGTVESAEVADGGGSGSHEVFAYSPKTVFSYGSDLSSASATGIGPFFSGTLSFTRTDALTGDGSVTGDFRVGLAAPGPATFKGQALGNLAPWSSP
jgi:hypothetical protein